MQYLTSPYLEIFHNKSFRNCKSRNNNNNPLIFTPSLNIYYYMGYRSNKIGHLLLLSTRIILKQILYHFIHLLQHTSLRVKSFLRPLSRLKNLTLISLYQMSSQCSNFTNCLFFRLVLFESEFIIIFG